jgi:hypothetical protein
MNGRTLLSSFAIPALVALCACNGIDKLPGTGSSGGALTVQISQGPPATPLAGQSFGLVANVANDSKNGGVTWSCAPAGACGTFNPSTTGYQIGTLYTPPVAPANGPVQTNLAYPVTITAASVTDTSQTATVTFNVAQQYAFSLESFGSWGAVGSITLDGNGNVINGEADISANGFYLYYNTPITGTYSLDSSGHGFLSLALPATGEQQTHGITAISNSHLLMAEEDNFYGYTYGGVGSLDLQTAGPNFAASQVSGGYSFTLTGYQGATHFNGSWGGIFTADGVGNLTGGVFDTSLGSGLVSTPFTGTFTPPDAYGRGTLTFSGIDCTPAPVTCTDAVYAYYIVTPEVLRLSAANTLTVITTNFAANSGTAFGQGSLAGAAASNSSLTGGYIFSYFGFTSTANGGEQGAAAGQFSADGGGNIPTGILDLNAFSTPSTASLANSTYSISGSPRGTLAASSGQTYNIYLTDPNLNLLDPNNTIGGGGALLLETDTANTIGVVIPQTDPTASPTGSYGIILSDQQSAPNGDGGLSGQFTVSATDAGTFSGEADFQGQGNLNATLITGPMSGTFTADGSNPGRFTGTITTAPCFPLYAPDTTSPPTECGTAFNATTEPPEQVSYYMANSSQGFIIETDATAPVFGVIEAQGTIDSQAQKRQRALPKSHSGSSAHPTSNATQHSAISGRSR